MIGSATFLKIRGLPRQDALKLGDRHATPTQNALPLKEFRRGHHHDQIAALIPACLKQQGDIQHNTLATRQRVAGQKPPLQFSGEGMKDPFQFFQRGAVGEHDSTQRRPVHGTIVDNLWKSFLYCWDCSSTRG